MRSVVEIGASVPAFLGKLWKLVNDSETNHLISWSSSGKTFVIKTQAEFARELLPLYYKHNNMASFIRQLNMYGFHKITSVENGGLRYEKDEIEFSHPCFMRGHAYLLEHIKRKIANPKSIVASSESGEKILLKPEIMNKVLADVKQMKGKQESLDAKFGAMKQENEALWREVAILRQKHIKQQQIVNNLIQFLMSLVQPTRASNSNGNNVGVKRPYQLMINNAAHNNKNDAYPGRIKNIKIDKDSILDDINEDYLEDGPTIHELVHDDIGQNDVSEDPLEPTEFVNVDFSSPPIIINHVGSNTLPTQYHVTMEDGEDAECGQSIIGQVVNNVTPISPGTSKVKAKLNGTKNVSNTKNLSSSNSYMKPTADYKLPADIFASDDSVSDTGLGVSENIDGLNEALLNEADPVVSTSKDKMLGGIDIKVERINDSVHRNSGKKAKKAKENTTHINLADIKTELQDDFDWNNMTLATVNNMNRLQSVYKRDNNTQNREENSSLLGTNSNKNDIDDHLDTMQTDLDSIRDLLRSDSYSLDSNTLLGLFTSDDPFYGLSYSASEERPKPTNAMKLKGEISDVSGFENRVQSPSPEDDATEGNELISYSGNIPDLEDISIPDLDGDNSQDGCLSDVDSSTLNTPHVQLRSPVFMLKK
ncbi:heat shock factor protein isoform X3 [Leptidea sinapis]|uniref:heat shock factor protein isoform X3 n=1 Tax=Leptidea sinapis TaxID=189913 RepID=UPI0021C48427|nr:heat shock factor protein isoform X3 [Leptidea sinapis]